MYIISSDINLKVERQNTGRKLLWKKQYQMPASYQAVYNFKLRVSLKGCYSFVLIWLQGVAKKEKSLHKSHNFLYSRTHFLKLLSMFIDLYWNKDVL